MGKEGIRPYGPGKFDSIIDQYAYELTLDGGADREESYPDGGGWFGFLELDDGAADRIEEIAAEAGDALTADEEALLDASVAVILSERSDGGVEAEWFDDRDEAEEAWAEIEAEFAETEGDE